MQTTGNSSQEISLYFHIPFCTRKCDYCHFYVLPDKESSKSLLLEAFQLDWMNWLPILKDKRVVTIYFGGGTPSLFGPARIHTVLSWIKQQVSVDPQAEITLEANPEHITSRLMREYAEAGINRVSIGIQTFDNPLLQLLGRQHTASKAEEAIYITAESGLSNISIDLMYDLPRQTLQEWEHTLRIVQQLPITHLSLYNLTIEPHTIFFKNQTRLQPLLPNEETSLAMYEMAIAYLEQAQLKQYEISAFAKGNNHSRHNVGYWTARPFLGFGPSAFSYWEGRRFRCISHLTRYYQALKQQTSPLDFDEKLDLDAHRRELFTIHIRLCKGVSLPEFQAKHGNLDADILKSLDYLKKEYFITQEKDRVYLTKKGILFYDTVAAELI